ncbi:hypothetical protein PS2_024462 [Malus domestica]
MKRPRLYSKGLLPSGLLCKHPTVIGLLKLLVLCLVLLPLLWPCILLAILIWFTLQNIVRKCFRTFVIRMKMVGGDYI